MKRGQATLDYILIAGIVMAAIIAMAVYISRGLQGKIRSNAEQLSSQQYAPGKTKINNSESKMQFSTEKFESYTTVQYGNMNEPNPQREKYVKDYEAAEKEVARLYKEWEKLRAEEGIAAAKAIDHDPPNYKWLPPKPGSTEKWVEVEAAMAERKKNSDFIESIDNNWPSRTPNKTSPSIAESGERGTTSTTKHTDEALSNL